MSPSLLIAFPHIIYILKPLKNHLIRYYHARFGEFYVSQHTGLVWVMTYEHIFVFSLQISSSLL